MTQPSAQILAFPYRLPDPEMPLHLMSDCALVWENKARIARIMNMVATGEIAEIPEEVKENIRLVNSLAMQLGFAPLIFDL